jgi:hypothetical protein
MTFRVSFNCTGLIHFDDNFLIVPNTPIDDSATTLTKFAVDGNPTDVGG